MPSSRQKITCVFCGAPMKVDFHETVKDDLGRQRIRVHFTCGSKDCGRPYIDGRSIAECMAAAREKHSKKARGAAAATMLSNLSRVIIHDETDTDPVSDLTRFGELLKAKENGTNKDQ